MRSSPYILFHNAYYTEATFKSTNQGTMVICISISDARFILFRTYHLLKTSTIHFHLHSVIHLSSQSIYSMTCEIVWSFKSFLNCYWIFRLMLRNRIWFHCYSSSIFTHNACNFRQHPDNPNRVHIYEQGTDQLQYKSLMWGLNQRM